ncbi:MAG TPA: N-acetylmuramoyl-L-alanine amidase [Trichocoleus sp.]
MQLNRLVASLMGVAGACVVGVPAKAAQLQSWQFDASQNRLSFTTNSSVQPRAVLLANPNRLVVELPGIGVEEAPISEFVGGSVQTVRVEQTDDQATRMVLELSPSYPITSRQIQVWGVTSQQWVVQLPDASAKGQVASPLPPEIRPHSPTRPPGVPAVPTLGTGVRLPALGPSKPEQTASSPAPQPEQPDSKQINTAYAPQAGTQLQGVVATPNGFFIQTNGSAPQVQVYRVRDRNQSRQLVLDVINAQLTGAPSTQPLPTPQYGVNAWSLTQFGTSPPAVRIILTLDANAPDWQVTPIRQGGIVLLPMGATPAQPPTAAPAVAQAVPAARPVTLPPISTPPASTPAPPPSGRAFPPNSAPPNPTPLTLPPIGNPVPQNQPVTNRPIPQGQLVVVLDPGHGGADPGAVGIGGIQEKQIVMAITQQVAAALRTQGVAVVLTRQGDEEIDLQPRVDTAEAANARLFVSIHANAISLDRPEVNGVETYYYSDMGARFAEVLHRRVVSLTSMIDRGTRQSRFYVLRRTSMPAVLIETGFVTGAIDAPQLSNPTWQARMGSAIAQGILDYLYQGQ